MTTGNLRGSHESDTIKELYSLKFATSAELTRHRRRPMRPLEEVHVSLWNIPVTQVRGHSDAVNAVVAVCAATGAVAAIEVVYDEATFKGYGVAVEQITKPKRNLKLRQSGLEEQWNVSGIPEMIIFDDPLCILGNVADILEYDICSAHYAHGSYQTAMSDRVLRLFARALPGQYRFENAEHVRQLLHKFVIEFYHNQPFYVEERVETPMEAWARAVQEFGVRQSAAMR